jgi:DNA-binding response OmpR family regulator
MERGRDAPIDQAVRPIPTLAHRSTLLPVELIEWDGPPGLRRALANAGVPRILLVERGTTPPISVGVDEAWLWSDVTDSELEHCAHAVLDRLRTGEQVERVDSRTWSYAGRAFRLSRLQARLFAELASSRGTTVARDRLLAAGWERSVPNQATLSSAIQRLRTQLVGTGLQVRSTRQIGFVLV